MTEPDRTAAAPGRKPAPAPRRRSAGLLLFRHTGAAPTRPAAPAAPTGLEVLLGHMGGPYFAKKDAGAWTVPKGEYEPGEEAWHAARREFQEELGLPPPDVKPILRAAVALFRRHQQAQDALARSQRELADRVAIARAKALLMRERRLTEPQAHRWLQRQAMARGARIAEVAETLLLGRDKDPGGPTP